MIQASSDMIKKQILLYQNVSRISLSFIFYDLECVEIHFRIIHIILRKINFMFFLLLFCNQIGEFQMEWSSLCFQSQKKNIFYFWFIHFTLHLYETANWTASEWIFFLNEEKKKKKNRIRKWVSSYNLCQKMSFFRLFV